MGKKVAISCGPIPARLDSVKFITNRFKGGLAFKTAAYLANKGHGVTIVAWKFTAIPADIRELAKDIVQVSDVFEYYDWFVAHAKDYDAFVMAAAVANLTPANPYRGKFPSHDYKPGDEFDIKFMIAPRAIDAIKTVNPRACLIGYKLFDASSDDELIEIARHTQADSKANIIFANTPQEAKSRKLAVMADNSVVACNFDEHMELIDRAIRAEFFKSVIQPISEEEKNAPEVISAIALVEMFEKTFPGFGTVAVPAGDYGFVTTARGHKAGPVLVRSVNFKTKSVIATDKATLNAPTLAACIKLGKVVVHRHFGDADHVVLDHMTTAWADKYLFPGTVEEADFAKESFGDGFEKLGLPYHGYVALAPICPVDWEKYHSTFPEKYFSIPDVFQKVLDQYSGSDYETLEVGGNENATGRYAYDPFVKARNSVNLTWDDVCGWDNFDLIFARNAVNYLTEAEIEELLEHTDKFISNTFLVPPEKKITENETAIRLGTQIRHFLRLPHDTVLVHGFYAYDKAFWESLGLDVTPYGKNSAIISKGLTIEF